MVRIIVIKMKSSNFNLIVTEDEFKTEDAGFEVSLSDVGSLNSQFEVKIFQFMFTVLK